MHLFCGFLQKIAKILMFFENFKNFERIGEIFNHERKVIKRNFDGL